MNNDNNIDDNEQQPLPPHHFINNPHLLDEDGNIPEHMRIQDFDTWLERNAIRSDDEVENDTLDRQEEVVRFQQEQQYQQNVHSTIFAESKEEIQEKENRRRLLNAWQNLQIDFVNGQDGSLIVCAPLSRMAESCDTVFVVALSWSRGDFTSSPSNSTSATAGEGQQQQQDNNDSNDSSNSSSKKRKQRQQQQNHPSMLIDDNHSPQAILYFVDLVLGKIKVEDLPSGDMVISCLKIAHYLQCAVLLDEIDQLLQNSIDTDNCYSLTQLADQLNLPTLLERSLSHMMDSLGNITALDDNNDDGQGQAVAEYLTPELQNRIVAIQAAIQSSIHSQRSRLYFASLEEYLAIFAERVQYYRERLYQAKEQQQQLLEEDTARQQRATGRFVSLHLISNSRCYQDTQAKIEKQEERLRTLEIAYSEQKKLFANNNNNNNNSNGINNNQS